MRKGCKWPWKKASFPSKPPLHGLTFVTDKWLSPLPKVRHCVRSSDTESICGRHHQLLKLARSISTLWITSNLSYFYESQTTGIYFQCKSIYWYLCCTFSSWILHQGFYRRLKGTNLFRIGVCAQWYNTNTISSVIDTSLIIEGAKTILLNTCRHALNNSVSLVLVQQWHFLLPPSFFLFFLWWYHWCLLQSPMMSRTTIRTFGTFSRLLTITHYNLIELAYFCMSITSNNLNWATFLFENKAYMNDYCLAFASTNIWYFLIGHLTNFPLRKAS